jgi:hypothetical protein
MQTYIVCTAQALVDSHVQVHHKQTSTETVHASGCCHIQAAQSAVEQTRLRGSTVCCRTEKSSSIVVAKTRPGVAQLLFEQIRPGGSTGCCSVEQTHQVVVQSVLEQTRPWVAQLL